MKRAIVWVVCASLATHGLAAQQQKTARAAAATTEDESNYQIKLIPLHHLLNIDGFALLQPYLRGRGSVDFVDGLSVRGVTVRATPATIAEMEKLIAQYDRPPMNVSLNFQLIAADNSARREPSLAALDSVLRGVLRFTGYHLLTTALVNVSDGSSASQTLNGDGNEYRLQYDVTEVTGTGTDATAHVQVILRRVGVSTSTGAKSIDPIILQTGLTIPIGHTVVLGSSSDRDAAGSNRVLILTVRPQAAPSSKDE